jgi:hypothetical protein
MATRSLIDLVDETAVPFDLLDITILQLIYTAVNLGDRPVCLESVAFL